MKKLFEAIKYLILGFIITFVLCVTIYAIVIDGRNNQHKQEETTMSSIEIDELSGINYQFVKINKCDYIIGFYDGKPFTMVHDTECHYCDSIREASKQPKLY